MGAFNTLQIKTVCPSCETEVDINLQFKYGDTWQFKYEIGDILKWGGNDIGKPGLKRVAVDAVAEGCPSCGFAGIGDYEILVENDRVLTARPASGEYNFSKGDDPFVVIKE